ncbi:hypothetical protein, partial [Corallococcus aberystwythensis]|uniref:hypothetical protein n=1 Tax=Corallococcus aberystwythensis TaxID=2316722 RepID=UPI001ABF6BED
SQVRYWIKAGVLTPERDLPRGFLCFRLTRAVEQRIQAALARGRKRRSPQQPHRSHTHFH